MKARAAATPIALVVLAAGAAAYAYWVDRGTISDADRAARRADVFPSFRVDEVSRIRLDHGPESLVLVRGAHAGVDGAATWTMTSPRQEPADGAAVDQLLRELELAIRVRDVKPSETVGLDAARVRGTLEVGPLKYRFALGSDAPRPSGAAYMRLEGEGTFVVGRALKVQLLRTADAYRERMLVPYGESAVARLEVRSPTSGFVLERATAGTFRIDGHGLRASRSATDRLFVALADARAESFLDDARAGSATSPPAFTVLIAPRDGRAPPLELRIGGPCPGDAADVAVVRTSPRHVSACVAKSLVDTLRATPEALADTSPFYARPDEVEDLRIERLGADGAPRVDLARRGTGWHERSPDDRELGASESESADALVEALTAARATSARPPREGEHIAPRTRVTIVRTGSAATEVVDVGPPGPDGGAIARRADDGAILWLPRTTVRRFEPHPVALRTRGVWKDAFDPGAVVAIDDTCGPTKQRLELRHRIWAMLAPAGFTADGVTASDLAGAVARAKANAWLAEADDGTFGFGGPEACAVTLVLEGAGAGTTAQRETLTFGSKGEGGFYAHTGDDAAVFVASPVLRALASHPAVDRGDFHLDPSTLTSIVLVRNGTRRALGQDSEDGELRASLSALYASSALHLGAPGPEEGFDRPTLEIDAVASSDPGADPAPAQRTPATTRITVGAPATIDAMDVYYARVAGTNATFVVPRRAVDAIMATW